MNQLKSNIDLTRLLNEVKSLKFTVDGSKMKMAFMPSFEIHPNLPLTVKSAIVEISKLRRTEAKYIQINILPAGVTVPIHTDTLVHHPIFGKAPKLERWHLVLKTNDKVKWWDKINGDSQLKVGYWYGPIPYWENHNVINLGTDERVHLIVDLNKIATDLGLPLPKDVVESVPNKGTVQPLAVRDKVSVSVVQAEKPVQIIPTPPITKDVITKLKEVENK